MFAEVVRAAAPASPSVPWWTTILVGSMALIGTVIQVWRASRTERDLIEQDLRIAAALEPGETRTALTRATDARVAKMLNSPTKRRDPVGMSLAIAFLSVGAFLAMQYAEASGAAAVVTAIAAAAATLLGATGLWQDSVKRIRDEKGRPIATEDL